MVLLSNLNCYLAGFLMVLGFGGLFMLAIISSLIYLNERKWDKGTNILMVVCGVVLLLGIALGWVYLVPNDITGFIFFKNHIQVLQPGFNWVPNLFQNCVLLPKQFSWETKNYLPNHQLQPRKVVITIEILPGKVNDFYQIAKKQSLLPGQIIQRPDLEQFQRAINDALDEPFSFLLAESYCREKNLDKSELEELIRVRLAKKYGLQEKFIQVSEIEFKPI